MSINEPKTEWLRLVTTPTSKALLDRITSEIAKEEGDGNASATVRRLIWQEGKRRGLVATEMESADIQELSQS